MQKNITPQLARELFDRVTAIERAVLAINGSDPSPDAKRITYDLGTAQDENNPREYLAPFKSVYVESITDSSTSLYLKPNSRDVANEGILLKQGDVINWDYPQAKAFLHWAAQSGKTVTLIFFRSATFKSGRLISVNSGGVSVSEGSSGALASVLLPATTATIIVPANTDRKVATIQNQTGADLWVGDSTVTSSGATQGIKISDGGIISWKVTGALYGYSVAGGRVNRIDQV